MSAFEAFLSGWFKAFRRSVEAIALFDPSRPNHSQHNLSFMELDNTDLTTGVTSWRIACVHWVWTDKGRPLTSNEMDQLPGRECEIKDGKVKCTTELVFKKRPWVDVPVVIADVGIPMTKFWRTEVPAKHLHLRDMWQHARAVRELTSSDIESNNNFSSAEGVFCSCCGGPWSEHRRQFFKCAF